MVCFVHFDLEMCFAHVHATTACTFSTSQLPKVVRTWCVLRIYLDMCFAPQRHAMFRPLHFQKCSECEVYFSFFTWKCVSRRNSVQFFITYLTAWLRTRSLSEPPFRPSGATNKVYKSRLSYLFVRLHLLSSHSFSSLIYSVLFVFSLTFLLSDSSRLCFSICPYCRKFDS